jgi:hypothetical protein
MQMMPACLARPRVITTHPSNTQFHLVPPGVTSCGNLLLLTHLSGTAAGADWQAPASTPGSPG